MGSFADEYFALVNADKKTKKGNRKTTKKKDEEEEKSYLQSFTEALDVVNEEEDEDEEIAPVKENKNIFEKIGAWSYGGLTPNEDGTYSFDAEKRQQALEEADDGRTLFQKSGLFDDGWQFGDVAKTIIGSATDLYENVATGIIGMGEKTVDALAYIGQFNYNPMYGADGKFNENWQEDKEKVYKETGEFIAKDLYDESAIAKKLISEPVEEKHGINVESSSVFGEMTDDLAQSAGQLGATTALSAVGVPWWVVTGVTSFGGELENAYNQGANYAEAGLSAAITAGAEILTEKISGGIKFGGKTLDDVLTQRLARNVSDKVTRTLMKLGMDMAGEGMEEVLSGVMSAVGQKLTYAKEAELNELFSSQDAWESFISGALLGGGSGTVNVAKSAVTGVDSVTGLTKNEQAVVDKVYQSEIEAREAESGEKLTNKEKKELYDKVLEDMDKGYIDTDTIESVLGGDTYKSYQDAEKSYNDTVESEEALKKELQELREMESGKMNDIQRDRLTELKAIDFSDTTKRDGFQTQMSDIRKQLNSEVSELVKGDRLSESYKEVARRYEDFVPDFESIKGMKHEDAARKSLESAVALRIKVGDTEQGMNNTNRMHDIVDFGTRISGDTGMAVTYTTNETAKTNFIANQTKQIEAIESIPKAQRTAEQTKLLAKMKDQLAKVESGKVIVNGNIVNGTIELNLDSKDLLNSVVGHEVTHSFEGGEYYKPLHDALLSYAKSLNIDTDDLLLTYKARYAGVKDANPEAEMIADMVGEYLFTDKNFVKNLSTQNRNVFQKIWDEVKYLCKVATAGSKEARELAKVQKAFEDAYRESGEVSSDTKYSISDSDGLDTIKAKYKDKTDYLFLHEKKDGTISIDNMVVKPEFRKQGIGNQILNDVIAYADKNGKTITLTPTTEFGTKAQLTKWYKANGFVENKGRNADYSLSDTMYRLPQTDTKYSLSDNSGKQLTKEQSEYFKDSKMRDENGNLMVMYHGSQDAGFHVFDARHSDDHTSFFFVDRNDVAASYSGTYETYEAKSFRTVEDANNFFKEIGKPYYEVMEQDGKYVLLENGDFVAESDTTQGIYEEYCEWDGVGYGDANYKVYLNLTNPLVVDAEGRHWNMVTRDFSQEVYDRYQSLTAEEKAALSDAAEWEDFATFKDAIYGAIEKTNEEWLNEVPDPTIDENARRLSDAYKKLNVPNLYDLFSIVTDGFSEESMREYAVKNSNTREYAQKAKAEGYDGVIFKNIVDIGGYGGDYTPSTVAIAFDSNQIKSVANDKPTADKDIRYSLSDGEYADTFYSHMGKVIDGVKQDKLGASSVVNMLRGKGVKAEEIKWSGIEQFLEGKKSVTKAELQEFVANSQLQIEEETLDNNEIPYTEEQNAKIAEYTEKHHAIMDNLAAEWERITGKEFPFDREANINSDDIDRKLIQTRNAAVNEMAIGEDFLNATNAVKAVIEANDNFGYDRMTQAYRSIVWNSENFIANFDMSAEDASVIRKFAEQKRAVDEARAATTISEQDAHKLKSLANQANAWSRKITDIKSEHYAENAKRMSKWGQYKLDGGENYREYLFKMPDSEYSNQAMAGHWGGERSGVLAHARVQDFDTPDGKMLFIEEIQSDWHNEGAKEGYADSDRKGFADLTLGEYEMQSNGVPIAEVTDAYGNIYAYVMKHNGRYIVDKGNGQRFDTFSHEDDAVAALKADAQYQQGTPDAPFRKNYHEFVLKNLIRKAAEEGYDSIGWTTADIQSERWSDEYAEGYRIEYDQDIPKFLSKYGKKWGAQVGTNTINYQDYPQNAQQVIDAFGETVADIEKSLDETAKNAKIEWLDGYSKVGDILGTLKRDGLADSYYGRDSLVSDAHKFLRDIIEGLDEISMDEAADVVRAKAEAMRYGTKVWSMPITEAMKQSVLYEGQPMYSLSNKGNPVRRLTDTYGKDIALETAPVRHSFELRGGDWQVQTVPVETAPVAETVSKTETVAENATVESMFPDDLVPMQMELDLLVQEQTTLEAEIQEAYNADEADRVVSLSEQYKEVVDRIETLEQEIADRMYSLSDEDAPPEVEAPYYQPQTIITDDPLENRDIAEVGNPKVKAYMYENPEVKPFFQREAEVMLGELQNSEKGEKWFISGDFDGIGAESYYRWGGQKRMTSEDIAYLLDGGWGGSGYTYAQIEKGLNAIIEDNGAENNAVSKRIEFILNDRLLKGYKDFYTRQQVEPNQDYIRMLDEKQVTEYSKEAFDAFMANADAYAPPVEDIAPVVEKAAPVKETPAEPVPLYENADGQQALFEESETPKRVTRKELHSGIVENLKSKFTENGSDLDKVLRKAKNLSTFATVDNTPQRVMEKALGYKEGQILADATVNKVAQNETEGIKWLNGLIDEVRRISKRYHIKPGSKESAAAQMYAEGFYVNKTNDIIKYGDAELAKDFPNAKVQANIKGLAAEQRIRQIYDETLAAINESRTRNAYPEIQRLDNYFLHMRAMDDTFSKLGLPFNPNDIRAKDLPTDLNGVTADLKPGQPYFASAMHRTGKRTSFDLLGGLERYLTSAKNQIYHIDDIQTLRALRNYIADTYGQANGLEGLDALSEEEAQDRIEKVYNSHLSTFAKFLNEEANILAGKTALIDRGLEGILGRRGMTFLNTVNKQVGSNMVGFNISSSLTNFLPVAQTIAKTNKADFVKAFAQTVGNKVGSIFGRTDGFTENSPVVIRRKGADRFYRTPWQKAGDAGYVLMSAVDDISTELIARTKYNELTRKGMDSQKAHYETDKWVSRLMGDRSLGQMPQIYNSKMLGLVTKFQLEVRNQLDSQFYDTIQEAKVSNEHIENGLARNAKTAAKVASTFVQLAVVQHLFGKAFESVAGYNPAFDIIEVIMTACGFDDDEDSEDTVLDNIEQGFLELLEDLPYTSTFTGGRIPISSALPIKELVTGKDDYGSDKSRLETLGEVAPYYLLPGGYGQIKKTYQGLSMFSDEHPISGSYTDSGNLRFPVEDTLANKVQAGIFGQWASENARTYFDNDLAPLDEKRIQEYSSLGLSYDEYWAYRDDMTAISKRADVEGASDEDVVKSKYISSVDSKLGDIRSEKEKVMKNDKLTEEEKAERIDDLDKQFADLVNERYNSYNDVSFDGDYANIGSYYYQWYTPESGESYWRKLTEAQTTKYLVTSAAGDANYATDGTVHYRRDEDGEWTKISDKDLARQNEVTKELGITPEQYWSETDIMYVPLKQGEYEYAYENPGNYAIAKAVGGYDAYKGYKDAINNISADKDANGKTISGSKKEKVAEYINSLDLSYGERIILYRSMYSSQEDKNNYNADIVEYLDSRSDISYEEMVEILEALDMKVSGNNVTW